MYKVNSNRNLDAMCSATQTAPAGLCTECDPLLFRMVGSTCVDHQYNGEFIENAVALGYQLGWSAGNNFELYTFSGIPAHHAVRIRFGIQYVNNAVSDHYYPISYSIDSVLYSYTQNLANYYSSYEIITSAKTTHYWNNVSVQFRNLNYSAPISGSRYLIIRDIILFSSHCQTGCLNCSSTTFCMICNYPTYHLNPVDHLCYQVCPQATYKNTTTLFRTTSVNETLCLTCNATCLECDNLTYCTRCYTLGRNESFLYNNTCVNPCPNLYIRNYTNHTCYCPIDYHFEDTNILVLVCYPCAA
jgi:hypothetical protein